VVTKELYTWPLDVQKEVYVDRAVSSATRADVIVVALESVERLIVDEPTTTRLLALPVSVLTTSLEVVAAARVEVAMLDVTVEPCELVVVTATVVGISVELAAWED